MRRRGQPFADRGAETSILMCMCKRPQVTEKTAQKRLDWTSTRRLAPGDKANEADHVGQGTVGPLLTPLPLSLTAARSRMRLPTCAASTRSWRRSSRARHRPACSLRP
jgi:hypothetical protein